MQEQIMIDVKNSWVICPEEIFELSPKEKNEIKAQRHETLRITPCYILYHTPFPHIYKTTLKSYINQNEGCSINSLSIYQIISEDTNTLKEQKIAVLFNDVEIEGKSNLFKTAPKGKKVLLSVGKPDDVFGTLKELNKLAPFSERMKDDIAAFFSRNPKDMKNVSYMREKIFASPVLTLFYLSTNKVLKNLGNSGQAVELASAVSRSENLKL